MQPKMQKIIKNKTIVRYRIHDYVMQPYAVGKRNL